MHERLSGSVIGPSAILPRGYLWLAPAWYVIAATGLVLVPWPPLWFRLSAAAGLLVSTVTFVVVLRTLRVRAFWVDHTGVRLGLPPDTWRRRRHRRIAQGITWPEIERIRIITRPNGVLLEFLLDPAARLQSRPAPATAIARARDLAPLLIWPAWYARRPTGLITAVDGPPRYQVPLHDCTVDDLRHVLRALAPSGVTVAVLGRGW